MKRKMLVICTSIAALHLVIGGAVMLGGCTGVQEDEPMPPGAYIPGQKQDQSKDDGKKEPEKAPETVEQPPVEDPIIINEPEKAPETKPEVQPPVKEDKPAGKTPEKGNAAPEAKKPARQNDVEYIIKKGDTYTKISKEFGVPLKDLMAYNPYPEKRLIPGRKIMIPASGKKITKPAFTPSVKVKKSYEPIPADGIYIVKKNDSFSKIASKFGLRASDIAEYNNLPLTKAIMPNQKLKLPPRRAGKRAAAQAPAKKQKTATQTKTEQPVQDEEALPEVNDLTIPEASISKPVPETAMTQIITEDTTLAKLAEEYASSEKEILKRNPHLAAGIVKRGTKVVL